MTPSPMRRAACVLLLPLLLPAPAPGTTSRAPGDPRDQPFRIVQTERIVFPPRLLQEGVLYGEARVAFHVDREGRLVDALVLAYTAEPFAAATLAALRRWKYVPARVDGEPGASVVHLNVRFETNGIVAIERIQPPSLDVAPDLPAGTFIYQPCAPSALDRPLRPVSVVAPDYPSALRRQGIGGVVTVLFYVDETGRPRLVVSPPGSPPALANLAIGAVEQWRFEPPTSRGRPVLVQVSQEFRFLAADGGSGFQ